MNDIPIQPVLDKLMDAVDFAKHREVTEAGEHVEEGEAVAGDLGRIFEKYLRLPLLIFRPGIKSSLPPF